MKSYSQHILTALLLCLGYTESQHNIILTTNSATFKTSITAEQGQTFSANEQFRFESAMSKLFHQELSSYSGNKNPVVVTSVHVEKMRNRQERDDGGVTARPLKKKDEVTGRGGDDETAALTLRSVVSVTTSDVGLHNALTTGIEEDDDTQPTVASILSKTVSSNEIIDALKAEDLVDDTAEVLEFSFTEHEGKTGVASTETNLVTKNMNDGWPMFWAGALITCLLIGIGAVYSHHYKKEYGHWPCMKGNNADEDDLNSVHFEGDIDIEEQTTASGVLGLKGFHPHANDEENYNPNSGMYQRKSSSRGLSISGDVSKSLASPKTQRSGTSSKYPVGIRSLKKLASFSTPQKVSSGTDIVPLYNIERLTRT